MGIKGLRKLIMKHSPNGIKETPFHELKRGSRIAIDTNIFINKYLYSGSHSIESKLQHQIDHIKHFGIEATYFIDGKGYNSLKSITHKKRNDQRDKKQELLDAKIKEYTDLCKILDERDELLKEEDRLKLLAMTEDIDKRKRQLACVDQTIIDSVIKTFEKNSVPFIICKGESDIEISKWFKKGLLDYAITEDLDFLTHGCNKVIFGYFPDVETVYIASMETILSEMGLTQLEFIDMCILIGCDYTIKKISHIGPVNAYKFINYYSSIEKLIEWIQSSPKLIARYTIPSIEDFNYIGARNIFINSNEDIIELPPAIEEEEIAPPCDFDISPREMTPELEGEHEGEGCFDDNKEPIRHELIINEEQKGHDDEEENPYGNPHAKQPIIVNDILNNLIDKFDEPKEHENQEEQHEQQPQHENQEEQHEEPHEDKELEKIGERLNNIMKGGFKDMDKKSSKRNKKNKDKKEKKEAKPIEQKIENINMKIKKHEDKLNELNDQEEINKTNKKIQNLLKQKSKLMSKL